ncbi:neuromedin-U receptor 2-like [Stylophora pistillata]|uniref:neuromedin-U receptor 2-like n=1 Tax=Stylophora pistillata TaxID=50429 RepID=UPI000C055343|nr:neuromedin-U receptor 2-like [Stylophora pistillata]
MAEESYSRDSFIVAFTFSSLLNLLGNILVCYVVLTFRDMRIPMNYLLVNLAISDMMVAIFMSPKFVFSRTLNHPEGTVSDYVCKIFTGESLAWPGALATDFNLVCVTIERYLAINFPYSETKRLIFKKLKFVIPVCWVFAFMVNPPNFMYSEYIESTKGCAPVWPTPNFIKYHSVINGHIFFGLPALIMGVLYTLLIYQLWFKNKDANASVSQRAILKHRSHTTKMVITESLIYCVYWFPNGFAYIYVAFSNKQLFSEIRTASVLMVSVNSAVNPVIYSLQSHQFRRHMGALFKRCRRNKVGVRFIDNESNITIT